tara:strand:+ start:934 stop:1197 length:264 start_codon:yes stop_codon:yes gene_type:complete
MFEELDSLLRRPKKKRVYDPSYGQFRRFCKKHELTYEIADDHYVDVKSLDGKHSTGIGFTGDWGEVLWRLETLIETGEDPCSNQNEW